MMHLSYLFSIDKQAKKGPPYLLDLTPPVEVHDSYTLGMISAELDNLKLC